MLALVPSFDPTRDEARRLMTAEMRADVRASAFVDRGPIYVTPTNAEQVIGQSWRWVRDTAKRLGVEILRVGGKPMIRTPELIGAFDREAAGQAIACEVETEEQACAELARRLSLKTRVD
jgi:hypothetical protein